MPYSSRNIKIACEHAGLTHFGGAFFFHEFIRVLQLRNSLARHLHYPRQNSRYRLSQMILALVYPIVLGLDRIETSSFLRLNGTFQYLTGLPSFPDPQTLRRFLLQAPPRFWEGCGCFRFPHFYEILATRWHGRSDSPFSLTIFRAAQGTAGGDHGCTCRNATLASASRTTPLCPSDLDRAPRGFDQFYCT